MDLGLINEDTVEQLKFESGLEFAQKMDAQDPLASYQSRFLIPESPSGEPFVYLSGNSLGLQPVNTREYILQELDDWADLGVEGHLHAKHPWLPYHENLTNMTARLVGAKPAEVVVMNTLTNNLHLMMVSFYRPKKNRFRILIEGNSFPSDQYAVASQAKFHGYDPKEAVVELLPRKGEDTLKTADILDFIDRNGDSVALIVLGNVNYLTGQAFDVEAITKVAHAKGVIVGLNLAHGAGNLLLHLHDWDVDFAVWCGYKYLNGGPGALAGAFVHERYARSFELPRFAGWWGHNKQTRFQMGPFFDPLPGAEGWQLSNPPILQLAALRASLELFDHASMPELVRKSEKLTGYLAYLLAQVPMDFCQVITPDNSTERGCQLSLRIKRKERELVAKLKERGVICDFREPNIMRAAPTPLYNSFVDVYKFVSVLSEIAQG